MANIATTKSNYFIICYEIMLVSLLLDIFMYSQYYN